jgi:N-ethylmaleimide reductase
MTSLFSPLVAGDLHLPNRIVMAPLTRARAGQTHIPNSMIAEYYAQRASAGLLIAEATMVASDGCAFTGEPGIFDEACAAGWKQVTQAVHAKGGRIMLQIWHPGRAAHSLLNNGSQPVSSTDRPIRNDTIHTPEGAKPYEAPRRLALEELPGIVDLFVQGAKHAMEAGFDGVQIHGAHGYLLDQFLRDSVNDRTDRYGGSIENRARLLLEVVDAVSAVIGAGRVSVRISPLVAYNDIADSEAVPLVEYVSKELDGRSIAFLELRHDDQAKLEEQAIAAAARRHFRGPIFRNGGFDAVSAAEALASGSAEAIVFGKAYIANPDLVERLKTHAPLNAVDFTTLYSPGPKGYTDYPVLAESSATA